MNKSSFVFQLGQTVETVIEMCAERGIPLSASQVDHACYRVKDAERYAAAKDEVQGFATLVQETSFGGRPVATFRLHEPVALDHGREKLYLLELATYKPGSNAEEGFEHVEFLTPVPLCFFMEQYGSKVDFDARGLHKLLNPTLALLLDRGLSAKFHRIPLDEIIRLEQVLGLKPGT